MHPSIRPSVRITEWAGQLASAYLFPQSCYEHIQKEDMRLHHLPIRWDSREYL